MAQVISLLLPGRRNEGNRFCTLTGSICEASWAAFLISHCPPITTFPWWKTPDGNINIAEPSNTSWPCPKDRALLSRESWGPRPCLTQRHSTRRWPVLKEQVHPDGKLEPRRSPSVAFPADTLWAKPNGTLCRKPATLSTECEVCLEEHIKANFRARLL